MRFKAKGPFSENIYTLMRKIGYHFQKKENGKLVFARPARGYPRFHIYLKIENSPRTEFPSNSSSSYDYQMNSKNQNLVRGKNLIFNLHLDQKRPIYPHTKRGQSPDQNLAWGKIDGVSPRYGVGVYEGAPAHAGEYNGEVVEKEAERIKQLLQQEIKAN